VLPRSRSTRHTETVPHPALGTRNDVTPQYRGSQARFRRWVRDDVVTVQIRPTDNALSDRHLAPLAVFR